METKSCVLIKFPSGWLKGQVQESAFAPVGTVSDQGDHHQGKNVNDDVDALKFFHVDLSNHLIVQRVDLVPASIQLQSERPEDGGSSTALASLNPFKANAHSQDYGAIPENRGEACRVSLDDRLDVGELKPNQRLKGLQLHSTRDWIRGVAWSDSELYVSVTRIPNPNTLL